MTTKRFLCTLLLTLGSLIVATAQAIYSPVELSIDSTDGRYAAGEPVTIYGRLIEECTEKLDMVVMVNGNTSADKLAVELSTTRTPIYTASFDQATSLIVSVGPEGEKNNRTTIGAVVAPEQFAPSTKRPRDIKRFWRKEIKRMRDEPLTAIRTRVPLPEPDNQSYVCYDIEISMHEGAPVRGYLAMPLDAESWSLPIAIYAHAAGVRKEHCKATPERALEWAKKGNGTIALDINAHGYLNGQPQSYYDDLENGALKGYSSWPIESHEEFYFRTMFLRLVRALDYLVDSSEWDGRRVLVYGESQGGAQAAAFAGIDRRVTMAVMNVPAMTDFGGYASGRSAVWPSSYSRGLAAEQTSELYGEILPYYDAALLLGLSKADVVMEVGLIDRTCPPEGVCAAFNAARGDNKVLLSYPYRPHISPNPRYRDGWFEAVGKVRLNLVEEYLK